jgi:hypothetical protein
LISNIPSFENEDVQLLQKGNGRKTRMMGKKSLCGSLRETRLQELHLYEKTPFKREKETERTGGNARQMCRINI